MLDISFFLCYNVLKLNLPGGTLMKKSNLLIATILMFGICIRAMAYTAELDPETPLYSYISLGEWETNDDYEDWTIAQNITDTAVVGGSLTGYVSGIDPILNLVISALPESDPRRLHSMTTGSVYEIRIRFDPNSANERIDLFPTIGGIFKVPPLRFAYNLTPPLPEIPTDGQFHVYRITLDSSDTDYLGGLDAVRFDPTADVGGSNETFSIDYFRIANVETYIPPLVVDGPLLQSYTSMAEWNIDNDFEGWVFNGPEITSSNVTGGIMTGIPSGTVGDPWFFKSGAQGLPSVVLANAPYVEFRLKQASSIDTSLMEIFFGTDTNPGAAGTRRFAIDPSDIPHDGAFHIYRYKMSTHADWNGFLDFLRIDPYTIQTTLPFEVDYIRVGDLEFPSVTPTASQGTFSDKVVVEWSEVIGATKYQVWRSETDDSNTVVINSPELITNAFDDTTVTPDTYYYYWVKAGNSNNWNDFGNSALGFATASTGPDKPDNLSPADGAHYPVSSLPVVLSASPYSDSSSCPMENVQWQLDNKTNFSSVDWDSGALVSTLTTIEVPSSELGITNYWRVRYKNDRNQWSKWSDYSSFSVERTLDSPLYFYETFNNVSEQGNVNRQYTATGRQLGLAAPTEYSIIGTTEVGDSATNPNKLTLTGADSACSPNISFKNSGNFKIEVDLEPSASGTAITFGKDSQNLAPSSAGGMAIVFYGDGSGRYEVYDGATQLGEINAVKTGLTITNDVLKSNSFHLKISVGTEDFDGSEARVAAFVNGEPLALEKIWYVFTNLPPELEHIEELEWKYKLVHLKGNGFYGNYISLYNLGGNGIVDNLQIQGTATNLNIFHWIDDADSRINSSLNYTHKVNLQDINNVDAVGVTFTGSGTGNAEFVTVDSPWLSGVDWKVTSGGSDKLEIDYEWDKPPISDPVGDHTLVTGTAKDLLNHIVFNKAGSMQIRIDVTPGSSNVFVLHSSGWFVQGDHEFLIGGNDGGPPGGADMSMFGQNNGCVVEYNYKAPDNGKFILTLTDAQHPVYAFSNFEKTSADPKISTINLLDFGEVVAGQSKTVYLPIFNIGAGIVSGEISGISSSFSFSDGSNYSAQSESPDFINIEFAPLVEGDFSNTVTLDGSGGSEKVELKGTGIPEPVFISFLLSAVGLFFVYRKN